jgi:hypothetical protein
MSTYFYQTTWRNNPEDSTFMEYFYELYTWNIYFIIPYSFCSKQFTIQWAWDMFEVHCGIYVK